MWPSEKQRYSGPMNLSQWRWQRNRSTLWCVSMCACCVFHPTVRSFMLKFLCVSNASNSCPSASMQMHKHMSLVSKIPGQMSSNWDISKHMWWKTYVVPFKCVGDKLKIYMHLRRQFMFIYYIQYVYVTQLIKWFICQKF